MSPEFRGRAFGLDLEADFEVPGLLRRLSSAGNGAPPTVLRLTTTMELDDLWPRRSATRTFETRGDDGRLWITIDHEPAAGYRVWVPHCGRYVISPDGLEILCAPPGTRAGRWRLLIGQALPIASALRGFEVLHASAVAFGQEAIAFVAPSGVGKTTLALQLAVAGAPLLADDVVALEATAGAVLAHAGARTANVPLDQAAAFSAEQLARLGTVFDTSHKVHVEFDADDRPLRLSSVYFLQRVRGLGEPRFDRIDPPDPAILLGNTYVFHVSTPMRRIAQLDVCSRIAETCKLFRLRFSAAPGAPALATAVQEHFAHIP